MSVLETFYQNKQLWPRTFAWKPFPKVVGRFQISTVYSCVQFSVPIAERGKWLKKWKKQHQRSSLRLARKGNTSYNEELLITTKFGPSEDEIAAQNIANDHESHANHLSFHISSNVIQNRSMYLVYAISLSFLIQNHSFFFGWPVDQVDEAKVQVDQQKCWWSTSSTTTIGIIHDMHYF